jgi:iron complex transport system permease protein
MKMRDVTVLIALSVAALAALVITPLMGMRMLSIGSIMADEQTRYIFTSIRVPRTIAAFLAGGGLALCGMVYQALFRNPLADPFTLGISSGASLGAALCIAGGIGGSLIGLSLVSVGAFAGALAAMALVYVFAQLKSGSSTSLLLAGVIVGMLCSSMLMFVYYISPLRYTFQIIRWTMGGVDGATMDAIAVMAPLFAGSLAVVVLLLPKLDQFVTGEDIATTRGVSVARSRNTLLIATSVMIAAVVAVCGPIAFVGIMAPHACRMMLRAPKHTMLAATSFLAGGTFLTLSDTVARSIAPPTEIPVGIITALCGGPFFLWILFRKSHQSYF